LYCNGGKLYQQGLEGYFRDPGFDQNTEQDSQKHTISRQDTSFENITAHEVGFAKMLAWDVVLGKKTVFRIKITEVQDAEFSRKSRTK